MRLRSMVGAVALLAVAALAQGACARTAKPACPRDNGGIRVPAGFCARVFARDLGALRHIAVGPDGTVYAALSALSRVPGQANGGIVVLEDTNGDGAADSVRYFGDVTGTGIRVHDGYLYFGEDDRIVRFRIDPRTHMPVGNAELVVGGFPDQHEHTAKSIAFDDAGHLYVNVGAPSNACQQQDRVLHSPGIDPCPLLAEHGGVWRFAADETGQKFAADARYATGLRNDVALAGNREAGGLWVVMMGRDQLHGNWPDRFSDVQSADLPAEEMLHIEAGSDAGWPYCYYDPQRNELVLAPEYGGNGAQVGRCRRYLRPSVAFPAHWAPEAIAFYDADAFPREYRGGAFVAFHGSWNRAPLPQQGFVVAFVPFRKGRPHGGWKLFATGFAGRRTVYSPHQAKFRPVGVAVAPDGALYVADSQKGWIWRITWQGKE